MAESTSRFESVAEGPRPSSAVEATPKQSESTASSHPSVLALQDRFGDAVLRHEVVANDQQIVFIPPERNLEILGWLRDDPDHQYDLLRDVTAVDYGGGKPIQVVYQLFSFFHKYALRVKCELPLDALEIDSVCGLWIAADWLEREVYDLFGVTFRNHPDLRRILMPPDYAEGHPLRKDFPLRGRFSRAEQTRRALNQDLEHYYFDAEIQRGGESQALPPFVPPEQVAAGEGEASGQLSAGEGPASDVLQAGAGEPPEAPAEGEGDTPDTEGGKGSE